MKDTKTEIKVLNGEMSEEEKNGYLERFKAKYPDKAISKLEIEIDEKDPDYVNVRCEFDERRFERIRRITGYLVGTLDRFNDAKRAEEKARVKHDTA